MAHVAASDNRVESGLFSSAQRDTRVGHQNQHDRTIPLDSRPPTVALHGDDATGTLTAKTFDMIRVQYPVYALALVILGCGSEVQPEGGGGSGGSNGDGGSDACAALADATSPGNLTIRFTNYTANEIYLPGACSGVDYAIQPASGPDGNLYRDSFGTCSQSCEDLQTDPLTTCEQCDPSTYRIAPGDSLEVSWDQIASHPTTMPAECWLDGQGGTACNRAIAAPSGAYELSLTVFDECIGDGGTCACDSDTGPCAGSASGGSVDLSPVPFGLPASGPVEVVVDACAFGCPQSGD